MDVVVVPLNTTIKEDIYIDPQAWNPPFAKSLVLKLNKVLYGLKQSPKEWHESLDTFLWKELKMTRIKTEQLIFVRFNKDRAEYIILAVCLGDLVISGTIQEVMMKFREQITAK